MRMTQRWIGAIALGAFAALLAWQVTLSLIPRALMAYAVDRVARQGRGFNSFVHAPPVTAQSRAIVRPSPDLLYSSCPFDLSKGPLLIDATPVAAPYWPLSIFDAQTNAVFVANNRDRSAPFHLALVNAGQRAQAGYTAVRVEGARGVALVRILFDRTQPIIAIDAARRATQCRSAS